MWDINENMLKETFQELKALDPYCTDDPSDLQRGKGVLLHC